jgi:four helix bundle protein
MIDGVVSFELNDEVKPYNIRHRSYYFAKDLIGFIGSTEIDRKYSSLFDQLLRSGTSIGANVVESKAGSSKKDWIRFLTIALKSANETKYWLCLIRDSLDLPKDSITALIVEADEISKIIASIIVRAGENK